MEYFPNIYHGYSISFCALRRAASANLIAIVSERIQHKTFYRGALVSCEAASLAAISTAICAGTVRIRAAATNDRWFKVSFGVEK
ncbi:MULTISPECIES: hypothetical protein [unclassified Chelatococcus]|uniref:hypothetical protein n=1 Tax=unclassified Chelatococcus TaxID=2638111 RepID=UPI001BCA8BEB|nr:MULTISPECIES: hypothetical protein [unclassified Chelatococcus]MBS7700081.1 hypothetical protein [Chelatococcus sp. YT9]MBX3556774.1 hypothetical protein [Chelatococcus sp.]